MARKPDLVRIVEAGTYVEKLEAIRNHLAASLITADSREKASIAKQLVAVLAELKRISPEKKEASGVDVLRSERQPNS